MENERLVSAQVHLFQEGIDRQEARRGTVFDAAIAVGFQTGVRAFAVELRFVVEGERRIQ